MAELLWYKENKTPRSLKITHHNPLENAVFLCLTAWPIILYVAAHILHQPPY